MVLEMKIVRGAIKLWVIRNQKKYWLSLSKAGPRYNLAGVAVGEVTAEEKATAKKHFQSVMQKYRKTVKKQIPWLSLSR